MYSQTMWNTFIIITISIVIVIVIVNVVIIIIIIVIVNTIIIVEIINGKKLRGTVLDKVFSDNIQNELINPL